jgi:VWFA-related protein
MTALWLAGAIVGVGQDARPTFRAGASRVSLHVVVKDSRGRAITDLVHSDFQVFDEGRAVQINDFRSGEEPVSIAILVDTSGSMGIGPRLATAKQALDLLLGQFRPSDEGALFTFDKTLSEIVPFSTDHASLGRGFERVDPFGSTSLHDAVAAVARRLSSRASARRAVVAITDGFDNSSQLSAAAASGIASSSDVPVYALAVANTVLPIDALDARAIALEPVEGGAAARLDELTARTGGASFAAEAPAETSQSVRQILSDLRAGYVVSFTPRDVPGWHQLTVRVARKNARVRTRAGFWMSAPEVTRR